MLDSRRGYWKNKVACPILPNRPGYEEECPRPTVPNRTGYKER
jgi:hypothetical protein